MPITGGVYRMTQTVKEIKALQGKSEKVVKKLMNDIRKQGPKWIAGEVAKVYGIKESEIKPSTSKKSKTKTAGFIGVQGETIETMEIVYKGRLLTPVHFGMKPKAPRTAASSYTLKAEILKGKPKVLGVKKKLTKKQRRNLRKNFRRQGTQTSDHSPIMLMPTGTSNADKTAYIPFQRKSADRNDVEAIKTISLPQMVSSHRTQDGIQEAISKGLEEKMQNYLKLLE